MVFGQWVMPVQCCSEARRQQHVICLLLIVTSCCYLVVIVFKRSFYKQLPKCVEATSGSPVARRPRAVPAQYSGPFVPSCFPQA